MSEKVSFKDNRLVVDRPAGNNRADQPLDVKLDDIQSVSFTRGVGDGDGALVVKTSKGDHVIRVSNSEGPDLLREVADKAHAEQDTVFAPVLQRNEEEDYEESPEPKALEPAPKAKNKKTDES
jgi:parvulin-like peptidyl-prolyl isomerase